MSETGGPTADWLDYFSAGEESFTVTREINGETVIYEVEVRKVSEV